MSTRLANTLLLAVAVHFLCMHPAAQDKDWRPVLPEELQLSKPKVEPDADAEALFWEVRVEDEYDRRSGYRTILNHYLKIKIFTERGRDEYNKVELYYGRSADLGVETSIKDIAARTTRADGSTLEIKPSDIFDKDAINSRGLRLKAKSFVLPGADIGSIVEYRWKEIRENSLSYYVRLDLGREIPVQNVKYYLKPLLMPTLGMRIHSFKVTSSFVKEKDGFYSLTMSNIPSYRDEPFMPSEYQVRPWMLVYYEDGDEKASAGEYWAKRGVTTFVTHRAWMTPNVDIRRKTLEVIGDAADETEKVRRIYDFCRRAIVNVDDDASGLTPEQKKNLKANKSAADVLSRSQGTWHDIQMLFGAMLNSIGFDPRVVNVSDRNDAKFDKTNGNGFFNRAEMLGLKIGDKWLFLDPASKYMPFGMIPWTVEDQVALISDPRQPFFVNTPIAPPDRSRRTRTARLRLTDDGTIEGDVRIEYTGHMGRSRKELNDAVSPAEREKALVEMIRSETMDTAEVTAISVENVTDTEKPFTYAFHIRLPSYGQKTGKRIFLQPNIFERGSRAIFAKSVRRNDIFFDYAWSETDDLTIEFPAGYSPESPEDPPAVRESVINAFLENKYDVPAGTSALKYSRSFSFGDRSMLEFASGNYGLIKRIFDSIQRSDTQGIIVRKD